MLDLLSNSLVIAGAAVLLVSLVPVRHLVDQLPPGRVRRMWSVLTALTLLFICGYVAYIITLWSHRAEWHDLIVPGVFFFGALFVWLTATLSLQTALDVRRVTLLERESEALRAAEERYHTIFESAAVGIAQTDPDGRYVSVNPAACRMLGRSREEIMGLTFRDVVHEDERGEAATRYAQLVDGRLDRYDVMRRFVLPDGKATQIHLTVNAVRRDGRLAFALGVFEDVTERLRLEEQFRQAQKMEAVGRLAGGVAHDFNNILTVIQGYAELLKSSLPADDSRLEGAEQILKAAGRAASLTRQLLAFSRKQVLEPKVIRLDSVVAGTEKMLGRLIGEDVELVISLGTESGLVKADPGQIEQVLMNLAVNARDAMPDGGRLTIEVANADLDETSAHEPGHPEPGRYVRLAISDTGVGMTVETLAHLFEPFFTTKGPGKGTGLGLATVYGIVKQSGGYVWASSAPGSGTTFRIHLPRIEGEAVEIEPASAAEAPGGRETILVVEDDVAVRRIAVSVLASRGYMLLEAGSAAEGLDLAGRHAGRIDLLLTDVIMPGMNGREMAERLVARRPELKVLFMSGYVDDAIVSRGFLNPGIHLVKKPFAPASLAREVRRALDGMTTGRSLQGART